ncbi:FKBP12-associated protein [Mortierella sp. NVP41]|nr:FKBP12-associated protein [Mortierella sp. NVP41]
MEQPQSATRPRLNPSAKDFMPSTSTSTQSRRSGKAVSGRIDDDHSHQDFADRRHNNSNNQQRRGGNRNSNGHSSGSTGTTGTNKHPSRSQRKELNGRTFPSAQTQTQSSAHKDHKHSGTANSHTTTNNNTNSDHHHRHSRATRTRASIPFVPKVEEDRGLMEALTVGLTNSTYDCMVCWDVIRPAHKIWNCQVCWAAFHLDCLSTWAKKSSEETTTQSSGWRCPGCQNTQVSLPSEYQCFCGKVSNPDFNRYLTPHSCGELCGRKRDCPHPCNLLCAPCEEEQEQSCYCGKHSRTARCGEGKAKSTVVDGQIQTGYYECREACDRLLACGFHSCSKTCHPHDQEPGECSAMPIFVKTCPCGSKSIDSLLMGKSRTSCQDPIPLCGNKCNKFLNCGHSCRQKCHLGPCEPCKETVSIDCRCGSTHVNRICSEMDLLSSSGVPTCNKPCRGLRSCGKHQCTNRCCPAKPQAKGNTKMDSVTQEAHACTLVCGKMLTCKVHKCEMLCHKGHCNPCLEASFDELSCACGRTVLYPPIACGTSIPKCRYACTRERTCGHDSHSTHPCHPDSEPCPPCTVLVAKPCMCRKSKMPNVPCYISQPSCGKVCGKRLDCGHKCTKSCHSGECTAPPSDVCNQPCPKPRKSCGHRCGVACHGDTPCPEDHPCQVLIVSSCKCGHLTKETNCQATAENPWDARARVIKCNDYCLMAERNKRVALALDIDDSRSSGTRIPVYSEPILEYATQNMEFTLKTERRIAEWIADTSVQVLHLPPMKGPHRKFIHELGAHYYLTSESVDMEPYRSVILRKNHNTSVPDLLASQASRQRRPLHHTSTGGGLEQLRKQSAATVKNPVNAIYLHDLVFGLTRGELSNRLAPIFGSVKYSLRWLTDDDAVLIVHAGPSMSMEDHEMTLFRLCSLIKTHTTASPLCEQVELCWVSKEGEVVSHHNSATTNKRFFSSATGSQLLKKPDPPKVRNAFALLLDNDRLEQDRILKAKEVAGTLRRNAWEEGIPSSCSSTSSSSGAFKKSSSLSRPSSPESMQNETPLPRASSLTPSPTSSSSSSLRSFSSSRGAITTKAVVDSDDNVVDDWQQLLDDDDE